jgi:hypothetical protein
MAAYQISLAELPDGSQPSMDFLDTAWFTTHGRTRQFPTPEELRSLFKPHQLPRPVKFEDLGLIVKFGSHISTTEAINLWAIRRVFQDAVPVPEVYGWRVLEQEGETREVFIYMQLVQGPTLAQQWPKMSTTEKANICSDLRAKILYLRSLRDNEPQQIIGKPFRSKDSTSLSSRRVYMSWSCARSLPRAFTIAEAVSLSTLLPRLDFLVMAPACSRSTEHRRPMERLTFRQWTYCFHTW